VYANAFGCLRFYFNIPSKMNTGNKFVSFKLMSDGTNNNVYGIGATLILTSAQQPGGKQSTQFREFVYQHTTDKSGYQDDRVLFGLGTDLNPTDLLVTWPNGNRQLIDLEWWQFDGSVDPIEILDDSEGTVVSCADDSCFTFNLDHGEIRTVHG